MRLAQRAEQWVVFTGLCHKGTPGVVLPAWEVRCGLGNKLDGNQPGLLGSDAGQQWVSSTQSVPEGAEKTLLVIMIILGK